MTAFASAIKTLNWTRGMIRLWLLVSVVWVIGNLGEARSMVARAQSNCAEERHYASSPKPAPSRSEYSRLMKNEYDAFYLQRDELFREKYQRLPTPEERIAVAERVCRIEYRDAAKEIASQMLSVPIGIVFAAAAVFLAGIALYIAAAVLAWVVRGFQRTETAARR